MPDVSVAATQGGALLPVQRIFIADRAAGRPRIPLDRPSPHARPSGSGRGLTTLRVTAGLPANAGMSDAADGVGQP